MTSAIPEQANWEMVIFFLVKHQHVNYRTYVYVIGDELCSFVSR